MLILRQGLKESFSQFSDQLARNFKVLDKADLPDKEHLLATLQTEDQWYWWQTITYFWNFTVASTIFMFLYVLVHILRCGPNLLQGLEFSGLELPDSFGELITSKDMSSDQIQLSFTSKLCLLSTTINVSKLLTFPISKSFLNIKILKQQVHQLKCITEIRQTSPIFF